MSSIPLTKMEKEMLAQKKRVEALKYLATQGQSISTKVAPNSILSSAKSRGDNTLEIVLRNQAKHVSAQATRKAERDARDALMEQQRSLRKMGDISSDSSSGSGIGSAISVSTTGEWKAATDSITSKIYYWNTVTKESSWTKPSVDANSSSTKLETTEDSSGVILRTPAAAVEDTGDWKVQIHPASRQEYFVHKITGEKRFDDPRRIASSLQAQETSSASSAAARDSATSSVSGGCDEKQSRKRRMNDDVDPLDPTGGKGDKRKYGQAADGKMADSTASGPLWQQRPYPAPGTILRKNAQNGGVAVGPSFRPANT